MKPFPAWLAMADSDNAVQLSGGRLIVAESHFAVRAEFTGVIAPVLIVADTPENRKLPGMEE